MRDWILWALGKVFDAIGILATVALAMALAFSFGHHLGFKSGLETKVTMVGEKYVLKLKGGK